MLTSYSSKLVAFVTTIGMMSVSEDSAPACEESDLFNDAKEESLLE